MRQPLMLYDAFICHASEDKDAFVRPLAEALRAHHIEIWYDEFALSVGDSIRRAIDRGLSQSRFGIVVLSRAFFRKNWPQYELDGLVERETAGSDKVILPIWYGVNHEEVAQYSLPLANRRAAVLGADFTRLIDEVVRVLRPQQSPLIIARDILVAHGMTPPVITDEYWLDVVEASNRVPGFGASVPQESTWGRWSFPLPPKDEGPEPRGERLAWAAMQLCWVATADEIPISVITEPTSVLEFIRSQPGLLEMCRTFPSLTAEYAPQLTIPGFSGELEDVFAEAYQESLQRHSRIATTSPRFGSALTTNQESPRCEEEWVLRDPNFGNYETPFVADAYFHGGIFGPDVAFHEDADHLIWLLSESSCWLPPRIHNILLDGLTRCTARWPWLDTPRLDRSWPAIGSVQKALWAARRSRRFRWSAAVESDWLGRIELAKRALNLPEATTELLDRVKAARVPERWLESEALLAERRRKATARNHAPRPDASPARTPKRAREAKLARKIRRRD